MTKNQECKLYGGGMKGIERSKGIQKSSLVSFSVPF